jgi:hypothetical protein
MARAGAQLAAWLDLAALGKMATQPSDVLVIYFFDIVCAEVADLAARAESPTATTTAAAGARSAIAATVTAALAAVSAFAALGAETRRPPFASRSTLFS